MRGVEGGGGRRVGFAMSEEEEVDVGWVGWNWRTSGFGCIAFCWLVKLWILARERWRAGPFAGGRGNHLPLHSTAAHSCVEILSAYTLGVD